MSNIFNDFEALDFINLDEMQWGGESRNLVLTASAGAYSAAGAAVSFIRGRRLSASAGAVVSTGAAAGLQANHEIGAGAGSVSVTGTPADFSITKTYTLQAAAGAFSATGTEADLQSTRVVLSDGGSYDVQGLAATLRATRILRAESGSVAALGKSVDLLAAHGLIAESGGCNLTGFSAGKLKTYRLAANNGVLEVAGKRAYLSSGKVVWLSGGSMSIEGYAAELTVFHNKTMPASVAEFLAAGFGVEFRRTYVLTPEGGSFQIQGVATGKGYHEIPSLHPANVVHEEDQSLRITRITSAGRVVAGPINAPHVRKITQPGQVVSRL